jgi:hypothetical protein
LTTVDAWSINAYPKQIPNFGYLETKTLYNQVSAPANAVTSAKITATSGWVMTCPGGDSNPKDLATPTERPLVGLRPEFQAQGQALAAVYSKDHAVARAGDLLVTLTQMRKKP